LVEIRQAAIWTALLLAGQATDVFTTAVDRARGALESMPVSARLLELGDISLLWSTKILLVTAAGAALFLTALWTQRNGRSSRITFRFCLVAVQAATLGLAWVSLSNVALLSSLLR
jgi:hypothetical protein